MSAPAIPQPELAELAARVERLEALDAIRQLVHRYAQLCDAGYDADGLAELFTEDAEWVSAARDGSVSYGEHHSRAAIRAFFAGVPETLVPPTLHYLLAPTIELDATGERGRGRWHALTAATMRTAAEPGGAAVLIGATCDHSYRRVGGAWRFSRLVTTLGFQSPLTSGWVAEPFVS